MSDRQIVYLTDAKLITCVLQNGLAEKVLDAAKNCGAQGATVSYARGTGVRDRMGLIGVTIDENKEVLRIIAVIVTKKNYLLIKKLHWLEN